MAKPAKKIEGPSPFERFEQLTKRLLAVPREELQKKLDQFKHRKRKKKRA